MRRSARVAFPRMVVLICRDSKTDTFCSSDLLSAPESPLLVITEVSPGARADPGFVDYRTIIDVGLGILASTVLGKRGGFDMIEYPLFVQWKDSRDFILFQNSDSLSNAIEFNDIEFEDRAGCVVNYGNSPNGTIWLSASEKTTPALIPEIEKQLRRRHLPVTLINEKPLEEIVTLLESDG